MDVHNIAARSELSCTQQTCSVVTHRARNVYNSCCPSCSHVESLKSAFSTKSAYITTDGKTSIDAGDEISLSITEQSEISCGDRDKLATGSCLCNVIQYEGVQTDCWK